MALPWHPPLELAQLLTHPRACPTCLCSSPGPVLFSCLWNASLMQWNFTPSTRKSLFAPQRCDRPPPLHFRYSFPPHRRTPRPAEPWPRLVLKRLGCGFHASTRGRAPRTQGTHLPSRTLAQCPRGAGSDEMRGEGRVTASRTG